MNYSLERPNEQKKNSKTKLTERDQSATTGDSNNNAKKKRKKNHPFRVEEDACRFDLEDSFLLFFLLMGSNIGNKGEEEVVEEGAQDWIQAGRPKGRRFFLSPFIYNIPKGLLWHTLSTKVKRVKTVKVLNKPAPSPSLFVKVVAHQLVESHKWA